MASSKAAALALLAALACLVCISAQGGSPVVKPELPVGVWARSAVHVSFVFGRLLLSFWVACALLHTICARVGAAELVPLAPVRVTP